ncbi:MAG TPA: DUF1440 domain-containing protein [Candidatus Elarobacter sp.]|nr:DUF1440 domain-containing protein [Candidatus Elarobacter sp.]HEV2737836.1 DUF1440 domain-containing protein [Candidatus Elarobacter sp.]
MSALRIAKAVAAGLAATWIMDRADELIYATQSEDVHRREAELEDVTGPGQFARAVMRAFGREPTHEETVLWGRAAHVSIGVAFAVLYPAAAKRAPWLRAGFGAMYGIAICPANLFVVPALGLTPPAWEFPIETSVRGVGYHIAYGLALEALAHVLRMHDDR